MYTVAIYIYINIDINLNKIYLISYLSINLDIYKHLYKSFACLGVCLYPIKVKTLNLSSPHFCGTSRDPREGLEMTEFSKMFVLLCTQRDHVQN